VLSDQGINTFRKPSWAYRQPAEALKSHQTLMAYPAETLEQFKWEKLASSQYLSSPEAKQVHWQARQ